VTNKELKDCPKITHSQASHQDYISSQPRSTSQGGVGTYQSASNSSGSNCPAYNVGFSAKPEQPVCSPVLSENSASSEPVRTSPFAPCTFFSYYRPQVLIAEVNLISSSSFGLRKLDPLYKVVPQTHLASPRSRRMGGFFLGGIQGFTGLMHKSIHLTTESSVINMTVAASESQEPEYGSSKLSLISRILVWKPRHAELDLCYQLLHRLLSYLVSGSTLLSELVSSFRL
jgi:hypothetical protein